MGGARVAHGRLILSLAVLLAQGCAVSLQRRPAQVVAPIGVQLMSAVEAAVDVVIGLGKAGTIPPDQERRALEAAGKIGHAGKRLASALRTLDGAQDAVIKAQSAGEVSALLDVLNGLVFDMIAPFTDASVRVQVAGLLREVNALLLAISGAIVRAG